MGYGEVQEFAEAATLYTWSDQHPTGVALNFLDTEQRTTPSTTNFFVMIRTEPRTEFLPPFIALDSYGFVLAGGHTSGRDTPYATSVSGVFAVGDIRAGSVKRVVSARGEGAVVVVMLHSYLSITD